MAISRKSDRSGGRPRAPGKSAGGTGPRGKAPFGKPRGEKPPRDGAGKGKPPRDGARKGAPPKKAEVKGLAARQAALDMLTLIRAGDSLDAALDRCRSFAALEGPDRGFARMLVSAVLRRQGTIDSEIGAFLDSPLPKRAAKATDILRLVAAQTGLLGTPDHAAVSTAVELAQGYQETAGYAALVNAVARKLAARGRAPYDAAPVRADTPGWLWRRLERAFGPATARAVAEAHRAEPPLDLTPRDRNDAATLAERTGAALLPSGSLRLMKPGDVTALPGYREGAFWVQDAAAALPVRLFGDVAGKRALDLCAAPGGKTLQLAASGARVTAVDAAGHRLKLVAENLARTGLAAETVKADILAWSPDEPAEIVLLDAPCTATGTIRRHPEVLWSRREETLGELVKQQAAMLDRAAGFVAPGGMLVYAACSLLPEEGEQQIAAFLARHPHFERVRAREEAVGLAGAVNVNGEIRTLPALLRESGGVDGFYAAGLRRRPDAASPNL